MDIPLAYKKQILFVGLFGIVIYAGYNEASESVTNYKRGLLAAAFVLVSQGILNQYTGPFTKRFPRFWRGVSRYTLIYLAILIFILYQTAEDARGLMKHLYPELGKPVTRGMHTYDENCDLEWENIWDNFDHYYLMHLVGWFVSALMVRDVYILHFWSVLDEILELSWQHILPHFRECWWDHVIVDLLLSNTPAIYLGMYFIKKTGLREFDWLGRKGKKSIKEWDIFVNHRRLGCFIMFFMIMTSNFLGGFFIINALWIPPKNFINVYRLSVWFLLGSISIGELYDDVESWGTPQRLTTPISNEYRWIVSGVTLLEGMISYKFRHDTGNIQDVETPLYITIPWILTVGAVVGYYLYLRFVNKNRVTKGGDSEWEIEERRKKSTRLAEKEKKLKAKAEAAGVQAESQPKQAKNASEAQVAETANGKSKKQVADQKKQADNKAQPAPVKTAEPEKTVKKVAAPVQDDDDEWHVAGGSKGGKQQQQKPPKQQKKQQQQQEEEYEEEREAEEPVRHESKPVDEWHEIKSTRAIKKANKKKRE